MTKHVNKNIHIINISVQLEFAFIHVIKYIKLNMHVIKYLWLIYHKYLFFYAKIDLFHQDQPCL